MEENVRRRKAVPSALRVSRAAAALTLGRCDEAESQAWAILKTDPSNIGAMEVLARALWRQAKLEELLTVLDRLSAANPGEPGYAALRGSALQSLGRYGEAARAFERGSQIPTARRALDELQKWQEDLIRDLHASDPVFRVHFARSPGQACSARGLYLAPRIYEPAIPGFEPPRPQLYSRPS